MICRLVFFVPGSKWDAMRLFTIISLLATTISMISCVDDTIGTYQGCCGGSPFEYGKDSARLYVPNAITPNADGINDVFVAYANQHVSSVKYTIRDRNDILVHQTNHVAPNSPTGGWDLLLPNQEIYQGTFVYTLEVATAKHDTFLVAGVSCSVTCEPGQIVILEDSLCTFPNQVNPDGSYNPDIDSNEDECFD